MPRLKRRSFLEFAAIGIASSLLPRRATAQQVTLDKLMQPGPLPDKSFGDPGAPVTVIEYASMTCHHCLNFHKTTWPRLKEKYVDTGKVRFIFREFPLDQFALAAAMLARCAGDQKWYPMVDLLFQAKESWSHSPNPLEGLVQTVRQAGMSRGELETCLRDTKLAETMAGMRERASKEFGVTSTPTFFINGRKETGALTLHQFDKILEPLLGAGSK